jgi:hypothetical protein
METLKRLKHTAAAYTATKGISARIINKMIHDAQRNGRNVYFEFDGIRVRLLFANNRNVVTTSSTHETIALKEIKFEHVFEL